MVREHHAAPRFDQQGEPQNEEARIISAVIDGLLDDEDILAQVLEIYRCSPGGRTRRTQDIWVQVFRAPEPWQNQVQLWEIAADPGPRVPAPAGAPAITGSYRDALGFGTHANNALVEGVVSLLTEIVWSGVAPAPATLEVRGVIEGEYASQPPLPPDQMPHPAIRPVCRPWLR